MNGDSDFIVCALFDSRIVPTNNSRIWSNLAVQRCCFKGLAKPAPSGLECLARGRVSTRGDGKQPYENPTFFRVGSYLSDPYAFNRQ
jgi:hypothetical protein